MLLLYRIYTQCWSGVCAWEIGHGREAGHGREWDVAKWRRMKWNRTRAGWDLPLWLGIGLDGVR